MNPVDPNAVAKAANEQIQNILLTMDPTNDEQWTEDGAPVLSLFPEGTTRKEVTDAAPEFSREYAAEMLGKNAKDSRDEDGDGEVDAMENYRAKMNELTAETTELSKQRKQLDTQIAKNQHALAVMAEFIQRNTPKSSDQAQRMAYIASQNKARAERAEQAQKLREAGIGQLLQDANVKSPLDAAMNAKAKRGTRRPNRI